TVRALHREGARVVAADVTTGAGEKLAAELGCTFSKLDVTSEQDWKHVVADIVAQHGSLDVLVNAAGVEGDMVHGTPESTSLAEWRRVMSVNLDGTFLGCREALPVMKRRGAGSIINISSTVAYIATPNSTAYGASKAGVMQLTKSVALHGSLEGHRVRCNSVHPGIIATRMIESISAQLAQFNNVAVDDVARASMSRIPFGEAGRPEDVAELILFLASDESRYITGSEFSIDGGWRLMGRPKPANK
ncbi:MAG: SDR family oxidoreductase, partial [Xanthobacteraceae bacterium]|nr:SDR family oxidoreductase [Xanthobacteraceae bacterium]